MHYENVFYSYPMDTLDSFKEISRISKSLAEVPQSLDVDFFYQKLQNEEYRQCRNEVHQKPDIESMLLREAKEAFGRRRPLIQRYLGKETEPADDSSREWISYGGYFGYKALSRSEPLQAAVDRLFNQPCQPVGDFIYPRGAYRGWHTNKYDNYDAQNWAMFLIQVDEPQKSFFRFIHPDTGDMITSWDSPNSVNFFRVGFEQQLLWHCIASEETNRWSHGFLIPDNWREIVSPG